MRLARLAGALAGLAFSVAGPVMAQTLPMEMVLTPPARTDMQAPASVFALTPPPPPTTFQLMRPLRPTVQSTGQSTGQPSVEPSVPAPSPAAAPSQSAAAEPVRPASAKPPASLTASQPTATAATKPATAPAAEAAAKPAARSAAAQEAKQETKETKETKEAAAEPLSLAAAGATPVARRREPLSEAEVVARANTYFTNLSTLVADFVQVGGDGRRIGGTLYLQRPGKVRFEYNKPSTLEVVADGSSVAVRDTKLATQDLYSISQTPLKFLLREKVNLGQDIKITEITVENDGARVAIEDRSTLGGTSRITLYFDRDVENLLQWRIVDPQGFQTVVVLTNVERGKRVDQSLFVISYDRAIPTDNLNR